MNYNNNIANLFFEAAEKYPERVAIIHNDQLITYKELETEVLKTINYLKNQGVKKGDRVLVFIPMSADLYRIVLALFSMGAVAIFLDEWVNKSRMEMCCKIAQCKGFVGIMKAQILRWFSKELRAIPINLKIKGYKKVSSVTKLDLIDNCTNEDTALITFTTGSTGTPKAAKRTHGFLKEQFNALIEKIDPKPDDIDMPVLPIVLLINLGVGTTSLITDYKASKPNQFNPHKIIEEIKKHKINRITASPFFIKELSKYIIQNNLSLESVKKIFTGGAPVFPSEASLYQKAFPKTAVQIVYGSTEAEPISSIMTSELITENGNITKGLLVGTPYHKAEVKIIPISDEVISVNTIDDLKLCPINDIGEIIVAGPHVLKEYLNNDVALKRNKIFVDGKVFHRTGDSGYLDETGQLYLTGRCNTLFKQDGNYVCPFLWENYFQNLNGVEMGTVLNQQNQTFAVIELNDKSQKPTVEEKLKQLPIKVSKSIFVNKIPRDPRHNSKIDYEKLLSIL